jgi:hypothetical protein
MMSPELEALSARHLRTGWWMFSVFLVLGVVLEALHAWKVAWYLGPDGETRRLVWTLAHAHGTLFGLAHVALGATMRALPGAGWRSLESHAFTAGSLLVPFGFFVGGLRVYAGDPGLGIALVPPGVLLLAAASLVVAWRASRSPRAPS